MKQLILMRHAEADSQFTGSDISRPLTKNGEAIQKKMADYIMEKGYNLDAIIFSPFKRAEDSAKIILKNFPDAEFCKEPALGSVFDSYTILNHLKEKSIHCALLLGHAPTLSAFAYSLLEDPSSLQGQSLEFDKSSFAVIDFKNKFDLGTGKLTLNISPRNCL